ncbi:hypothetical protein CC2G_014174 [Coprinopsis cinerea AmutBmut pab1-1]|nr:hypothetical protein CC2G_014174 [Coprinopsis cinerea AmutBmut pab1-1]
MSREQSPRNLGPSMFSGASEVAIGGGTFNNVGRDIINASTTHVYVENQHVQGAPDFGQSRLEIIARWLTPINFKRHQSSTLSRALAGTGEWFIKGEKFTEWAASDEGLLWGRGMPGAGKTTLVSIVNRELKQQYSRDRVPILMAFCDSMDQQYTLCDILSALLRQLLEDYSGILEVIAEHYKQHLNDDTRPSEEELARWLTDAVSLFPKAFVTIDALDGLSSQKDKSSLLNILRRLQKNVFVTSRVEGSIPNAVLVDIRAHGEDIRKYISHRIQEDPGSDLADTLEGRDDFKEEMVSRLQVASAGMFLLTVGQMDTLSGCTTVSSLREKLDHLPSSVEEMYQANWDRVLSQGEERVLLAKRIIVWLVKAREAVTVPMLRHALAVKDSRGDIEWKFDLEDSIVTENTIKKVCCGLVSVVEAETKTRTIQLVHHTAKEFFASRLGTFGFPPDNFLAATCVGYLMHCGFENLTYEQWHGPHYWHSSDLPPNNSIRCWDDFQAFVKQPEYPFLNYAYRHWAFHSREASRHPPDLPPWILSFLLRQTKYPLGLGAPPDRTGNCVPCGLASPLHIAAVYGWHEVLPFLDLNAHPTSGRGHSALHTASYYGHHAFASALIS